MLALGKPCPMCEAPLQHKTLPTFSGEEGPLRITLHGMPALACENSHVYFAKAEFPLWLMNHLVQEDEAALPAGDATGLLFKSYLCHDCGKPLAPKQDHLHSFHLNLSYEGQSPFRVEISMPVYKCMACGKEQIHSLAEIRKLTPTALVHALKGAGVKPPQ